MSSVRPHDFNTHAMAQRTKFYVKNYSAILQQKISQTII